MQFKASTFVSIISFINSFNLLLCYCLFEKDLLETQYK